MDERNQQLLVQMSAMLGEQVPRPLHLIFL
jgi:hypothetical protein